MTSFRFASAALLTVLMPAALLACRGDDGGATTTGSSSNEGGGNGDGGGAEQPGAGAGTSTGDTTSVGGGTNVGCEGPDATIEEITTGVTGVDQKVTLRDVVVMSQKFLVSKSKNTGSCLWGVFVSAPNLSETAANTGLIILSYGTPAAIPEGETVAYCPKLGQDPTGDTIPDDVAPGDVLTVIGTNQVFPTAPTCTGDNPPNEVGMRQLSSVCSATRTGTAAVPAPHVLTAAEATSISSNTDKAFHDAWGGVKVRVQDVGVTPAEDLVVGDFGVITLDNGIPVGDKVYYRPYSNNECHEGPVFSDTAVVFDHVDGFHYLNFCSWGIEPNDKCSDFAPASEDCAGATTCPPDVMP